MLHLITLNDTHTHTQLLGLLWLPIGPTQRTLPYNIQQSQQTDVRAVFEPTIPKSERPQTHAVDHAVTGIGPLQPSDSKVSLFVCACVHRTHQLPVLAAKPNY
jgi:hypothetical protein